MGLVGVTTCQESLERDLSIYLVTKKIAMKVLTVDTNRKVSVIIYRTVLGSWCVEKVLRGIYQRYVFVEKMGKEFKLQHWVCGR